MSQRPKDRYLLIDIETSGLSIYADTILEVWCQEVNPWRATLIGKPFHRILYANETRRAVSDPLVQRMHDANGLWEECRKSTDNLLGVSRDMAQYLTNDEQTKWAFVGNSVHFDRQFVTQLLPHTKEHVSHRVLDVSGMARHLRRFRPFLHWDSIFVGDHRARNDAMMSLDLLGCINSAVR